MTHAPVWRRGVAYLLDWVDEPLIAIGTSVWLVRYGGFGVVAAGAWISWLALQLHSQARTGQTFGKQILQIAVVDADTQRPLGLRRTMLRWAARSADTLMPIQWLRCAKHPGTKTIADRIARSVVLVPTRA